MSSDSKVSVIMLLISLHAVAQQPPTWIRFGITSANRAELAWRNNALDMAGNVIYRSTDSAERGTALDTLPASASEYVDSTLDLAPRYCFTVAALAMEGETFPSETRCDNTKRIFEAPTISRVAWSRDSGQVTVDIEDHADSEEGYRIYRSIDSGAFVLVAQKPPVASLGGILSVIDTLVPHNRWVAYKAVAHRGSDSVTGEKEVFFHSTDDLLQYYTRRLTTVRTLGAAPLKYRANGWSFRFGDSLFLPEADGPDSMLSVLDLSDPAAPRFKGYFRSDLPEFQAAIAKGSRLFGVAKDYAIQNVFGWVTTYSFSDGAFRQQGRLRYSSEKQGDIYFANDSVLLIEGQVDNWRGYRGGGNSCNSLFALRHDSLVHLQDDCFWLANTPTPQKRNNYTLLHPFYVYEYEENKAYRHTVVRDYRWKPRRVYSVLGWKLPAWPRAWRQDGRVILDSLMAAAHDVHLDSVRKLAYLVGDDRLTVVEYSEGPATGIRLPPIARHARGAEGPVLASPRGLRAGRYLARDVNGRRLGIFDAEALRRLPQGRMILERVGP